MSEAQSFEEQIADTIRQLYKLVAVLAVGLVVAIGLAIWGLVLVTGNENQACTIQSRGLSATPYLVDSLDEIHSLLTLPPTAAAKRQQATVPPKQLATELQLITSLDANLAMYVSIERRQPKSRSC